ncbi:30S ribosomal protein S4 [Litorilinea aerophila]|uniref:Small ribosomal subunit protein uS4 n=1 Tax=Litorilinea aerophila TaxID=1204385 RepID=A0A540VHR1_9CHLR|nr:30S ribosomal protein S4 [Litorilinea aerophila]MCC9075937.1 30S ribosomal protein S4 [Litorilinea aerophila]OUC09248.1 30S ribosomal protein S4 [Litorilinea aerophila]GIV78706.1 MAG: 30S ribosomal protein S4 [Litorilinea sp.]
MANYTDAVCKLCRREGQKLFLKGERCLSPKCAIERRPYPPGEHGKKATFRRKVSDYGMQLREKQKARRIYGVMEKQFRRYFREASRRKGLTGATLLTILESRLDNVVYRLGFADSRSQARQLVRHGHFEVNGRKTDIPSYLVSVGDVISVRANSQNNAYFKERAQIIQNGAKVPAWLSLNPMTLSGSVVGEPSREDIEIPLNEQLIVEYYSR